MMARLRALKKTAGFTLVELLVVMAIIGVLVGLLLPAIQKVREAANRIKCQNNLKQIGVACHNYHVSHGALPAGEALTTNISAVSKLLPYLDQSPVYRVIDFSKPYKDPSNDQARMTTIPLFRCASDGENPMPQTGGAINYMANKGSGIAWPPNDITGTGALSGGVPPPNGVFYLGSVVKFSQIRDGLSQTAFFSERVLASGNNAIIDPLADVFWLKTIPNTPDEAMIQCQRVVIEPTSKAPVFMGAPWINGQHCYQHVSPPNDRSCGNFIDNRATMPPSSRHPPGGVDLLLGDGSVRYVTNSIDLYTWRGLGSRAGGEILNKDD